MARLDNNLTQGQTTLVALALQVCGGYAQPTTRTEHSQHARIFDNKILLLNTRAYVPNKRQLPNTADVNVNVVFYKRGR